MDELDASRPTQLRFDVLEDDDGCPLIKLEGELDMTNTGELEAAVEPVIKQRPSRLVVDLSDLKFADSSGVALWVRWANIVDQVEIRQPSALLRRVLERMGLAERLRLTP
jgi:anti-anti-sigma factor